ncbi:hypothetical protein ACFL60_02940 [Candidatus Omnitrophota bacterium]
MQEEMKNNDCNIEDQQRNIYNNVPITHFDFPFEYFDDSCSAAKYAWSEIQSLAAVFCLLYCNRKICTTDTPRKSHSDEKYEKLWVYLQKKLHRAISYLPLSYAETDGCPSCAVVKAFSFFPDLMKYSPIPPVITLEVNVTENGNLIAGENEHHSIPCSREMRRFYILRDFGEPDQEIEERIREIALLKFNFDVLPLLPPWELSEIRKPFLEGQNIVKYIYKLSHPDSLRKDDTESENKNDKDNVDTLRFYISNALVSAISLHNLFSIRKFYPNVLEENEAEKIHDILINHYNATMNYGNLVKIKNLFKQPDFKDLKDDFHWSKIVGSISINHPDLQNIDDFQNEYRKKAEIVFTKSVESVYTNKQLKDIYANLKYIMLFQCRIPNPIDDPSFKNPRRLLQLLKIYWDLAKSIIIFEIDAMFGDIPHPLIKLAVNILARIDDCFNALSDFEGAKEIKRTINELLNLAVSKDREDLCVVPEWPTGEIEKVDLFNEKIELKLGSRFYPLTEIEKLFIDTVKNEINKYQKRVNKEKQEQFKRVERNKSSSVKIEEIIELTKQFPDQYALINRMLKDGESIEVIKSYLTKTQSMSTTEITKEVSKNNHNMDPSENTLLYYWTTEGSNVLKISTYTNGEEYGQVSFGLNRKGEMTKQRALIEKLLRSNDLTVANIINICYYDEKEEGIEIKKILARVRALVSAIRDKFKKTNINPNILTTLGHDIGCDGKVYFKVKKIIALDNKHFEAKTIKSSIPIEEVGDEDVFDNDTQYDESFENNHDKHIDSSDYDNDD